MARKFRLPSSVVLAALTLLSIQAQSQQLATTGSFSVNARGSAIFSVPLKLPAGTGGLRPELTVVYDSEAGNGELGVGFSLAGLPRITRCPRTLAQDGVRARVNYTSDDGFCLNGERLVPISGANGRDGTEYRTQRDSFAKVTSSGVYTKGQTLDSTGSYWIFTYGGPVSFTVKTNSGLTMEFGTTQDSQITSPAAGWITAGSMSPSNPVKGWALHKVSDQAGNYWTVSYTKLSQYNKNNGTTIDDGVFYPTRIDYTGNSKVGVLPSNAIVFNWEGRSQYEQKIRYEGGFPLARSDMRLSRLDIRVGSSTVERYNLNLDYTRDNAGLPTRISSVEECSGMLGALCLPAVSFSWEQPTTPMQFWTGPGNFPGQKNDYQSFFVDMNGTGKKSWVRISQDADEAWIGTANADASFAATSWVRVAQPVGSLGSYVHAFADVDGDGKADWIRISRATTEAWIALGTGNGNFQFWTKYTQASGAANASRHFFADVDGDGRADWIQVAPVAGGTKTSVALATGGGNFQFWTSAKTDSVDLSGFDITLADIDGDGSADMLESAKAGSASYNGYFFVLLSRGDGTFANMGTQYMGGVRYMVRDINGDGLADVLGFRADGTVWLSNSRGDGTFTQASQLGFTSGADLLADFGGTGMADRLTFPTGSGNINNFVSISMGTGIGPYGDGSFYSNTDTLQFAYNTPEQIDNTHSYRFEAADLDGDGKDDLIWIDNASGHTYIAKSLLAPYGRIAGISNLQAAPTQIVYKPLSDASVYTPDADAQYPLRDAVQPLLRQRLSRALVASVASPNGIGGTLTTSYTYGGQKTDLARLSEQGFRWMQTLQAESGMGTRTEFRQDWPYTGMAVLTKKTVASGGNNSLLDQTVNSFGCNDFVTTGGTCTLAQGRRYFPYVSQSVTSSWDLNGAAFPVSTTASQFDSFGNPTQVATSTSDGYSNTTATTYSNDISTWKIGRPQRVTVTNTTASIGAAASSVVNVTTYEYDPVTGKISAQTVEPDNSQLCVRTTYLYDSFGNRLVTQLSSPATGLNAVTERSSSVTYDANGIAPSSYTNALGQVVYGSFDPNNLPTSVSDLNSLQTQRTYDRYGRVLTEARPDGTTSQWTYTLCSANQAMCKVANAVYYSTATSTQRPTVTTFYDAKWRVLRTVTTGFDGTAVITQDTEYDAMGRVRRTSKPYYSNAAIQWTVYAYDVLGRVTAVTAPDGSQVKTVYNGLNSVTTNELNQTLAVTKNSRGQVVKVVDNAGGTLSLSYDGNGNVAQTVDPKGNTASAIYDVLGRKLSTFDPDLGAASYVYDALGNMRKQTDAKGNTTTLTYDLLNRPLTRAEADLNVTWTYDSCSKGKGQLCSVAADNGYKRTHTYDSQARPLQEQVMIDTAYTVSRTYDAAGNIATVTYPTGLALKYGYTSLGYLQEIRNSATNGLYWQANAMDAEGHLLQQTYGNNVVTQQVFDPATGRLKNVYAGAGNAVQNLSYTYDARGNMLTRSDANQNLAETFFYDALNRLTSNTVNSSGAGLVTQSYAYDSIGNVTSRSDMGTYSYGAVNAAPHAVALIALAGGGTRQYSYDANGNLVQEVQRDAAGTVVPAKGRMETYTSFNMPATLSSPAAALSFVYGAEHQRIKQISPTATTIYLHPDNSGGLLYEKDIKTAGGVEHKNYITANGNVVAMVKQNSAGTSTLYFHRDNLGSTTAITNDLGAVAERMAYEPFGKRRALSGALDVNNVIAGVTTDRGFTNHEELDEVGLVHMNGRVFDPATGRFISADPHIQAPNDLQSYNRYSYVMNNPLVSTDPSGYLSLFGHKILPGIFNNKTAKLALTAVASFYTAGLASSLYQGYAAGALLAGATPTTIAGSISLTSGVIGGAAGGFAGGLIGSNGDLTAGLKGALAGAVGGGVSGYYGSGYPIERIAANTVAGGIQSSITGGSFTDGLRSSFLMSSLSYGNVHLRNEMIAQSKLSELNDGTGLSRGMFGDGFKLAGGRWNPDPDLAGQVQCSPLGCLQSGKGSVFGRSYDSGGIVDLVTESFAGPHDKANSYWFYDPATGMIKDLSNSNVMLLDVATNYTTSLLFAAPLATAAIAEQVGYPSYRQALGATRQK